MSKTLAEVEANTLQSIEQSAFPPLATICHVMGYLSIVASILVWYFAASGGTPEALAHAERFGIFIGLWAPTFFILSSKYEK